MEESRLEFWAHRGYSGKYPENTIVSFAAAAECGVDGIECDVRRTCDGKWVLMHDATVNRTTNGVGRIEDMTLSQVESLDAGLWLHEAFRGMRVPRLTSLLDFATWQRPSLALNLEWKSPIRKTAEAKRILDHIDSVGLSDKVVHSSFDMETLRFLRKSGADARLAVLVEIPRQTDFEIATCLGAEAIHPDYRMVTARFVKRSHDLGLRVRAYAVEDAKAFAWMEACEVDAVITDWPEGRGMVSG